MVRLAPVIPRLFLSLLLFVSALMPLPVAAHGDGDPVHIIDEQIAAHDGKSALLVLDKGEQALLARAWLADHARATIDVQYFIWSSDNIGILAAESLLRAAERGVRVRVIVDDLMIDAPDESLLALARHPNIDIRIYNPRLTVGTPVHTRLINLLTGFRASNQRMHDKTFMVDGKVAITGGRNMADEYYDYDHAYNFRDRDALVLGQVVQQMGASFERFWASDLSVPVEKQYDGLGLMQKHVKVSDMQVQNIYADLHAYAAAGDNFAPEVRAVIEELSGGFRLLAQQLKWGDITFISDLPGKNSRHFSLGGGGRSSEALAQLVESASKRIIIQSPYLILSDNAMELFRRALARGVNIRISTNSLASTDNLQAFSGYRNQRRKLLHMGLEIFEYRPDPKVQEALMQRYTLLKKRKPVFALHAKTMVIDGEQLVIGTFNLDPRSENLNTEVAVWLRDSELAAEVESAIERDMAPDNSWDAHESPDQYNGWWKRSKARFWQVMPIKPLL